MNFHETTIRITSDQIRKATPPTPGQHTFVIAGVTHCKAGTRDWLEITYHVTDDDVQAGRTIVQRYPVSDVYLDGLREVLEAIGWLDSNFDEIHPRELIGRRLIATVISVIEAEGRERPRIENPSRAHTSTSER